MKLGEKIFKQIDVDLLKEAPYNVAGRTTDEDIPWLSKSIADKGVMQHLIVVEPEGDDETYEIVCGNRRAKAAKEAGKRTVPCDVISKDYTSTERRLMNLTENVHRKDLTYQDQYEYVAEIMKAFNDKTALVAAKINWPEIRVIELVKYGSLPERVKETVESPNDFRLAMAAVDLSEEKALELMQVAREQGLSSRQATNIAESMKNDPKLKPLEALGRVKSKGTRISITLDGEWNAALTAAVLEIDSPSKQAYAEEALKQRLVKEGFGPQVIASSATATT
jgi:ParB family chromosome partitioning protein